MGKYKLAMSPNQNIFPYVFILLFSGSERIYCSNPVALPDLYFHSSVWPIAFFVIRARGIVSVVSSIVSFSNHRSRLESYRFAHILSHFFLFSYLLRYVKMVIYGRLPFDTKFQNFRNGDKLYRNFSPGKSSRKCENCWNSEKRTIQPKIPEIPGWKSNGTEISRKIF